MNRELIAVACSGGCVERKDGMAVIRDRCFSNQRSRKMSCDSEVRGAVKGLGDIRK